MKAHTVAVVSTLGMFLLSPVPAEAQDGEDHIAAIQQFLEDRGCDPNGVDGQWGGGSRAAADRYFQTSGVRLGPDLPAPAEWPARFTQPACGDETSFAPLGQLTPYETPSETIVLPGGIEQFNWIPAHLRDFAWPESGALTSFDQLSGRFTAESLKALGCLPGAGDASHLRRQLLEHDISYEGLMLGDFPLLTVASDFLYAAICSQDVAPLQVAADVLTAWSQREAFENYGLKAAIAENRDDIMVREDASQLVSFTLVSREQIAQFLVLWMVLKSSLPDLPDEDIISVESWFERLVEEQAFTYAETPLDCPSFNEMPPGLRIPGYMRGNQFEECINTGTSRAGISALWALVSGDRSYAEDALNTYFMTLHQLRADGSHSLESPRGEIAHYKAGFNLAWMHIVAESFLSAGTDIYSEQVHGKSLLTMAEFIARAAVDEELSRHYSGASEQEHREFKDAAQWIVLNRFPDSTAARLITRQLAATLDRDQVLEKFFRLRPPGDRQNGTSYLHPLLPLTALFAPSDVLEFAPPDIAAAALNTEGFCPDMGWTEADEQYAGGWLFRWSILNIFDGSLRYTGIDGVELANGRGTITSFATSTPLEVYRRELDIAYGNGRLCVAGHLNLFDPTPTNLVTIEGAFVDEQITGLWPDGDEFGIGLTRKR